MDALTTGAIAVTIVAAIGFFIYRIWGTEEDTYAKAVENKQLYTLEEAMKTDNKKDKEKEKQKKKQHEKKKATATSAESKEDKPAPAPAAPAAAAPTQESPVPAAPAPKKESPVAAKKEQPKPEEPKKKESPAKKETVVVEQPAVKKDEEKPLQAAAPEPKKSAPQSNGEKKTNKKASPNKQVEEIENEDEFVEAKTKKAKKIEKKEAAPAVHTESTAPRHLSLKDLDTNKVVSRLSSIDELEVEYIEYLNNFFRDTQDKNVRALTDNARAARLADESARAMTALNKEKAQLEADVENKRRTIAELAANSSAAGGEVIDLRGKLAATAPEMDKLRRELEAAKKAAAAIVIPDNKEELEKLKADAKSAAGRIAELEETLKNTKDSAAKERKQFEQSVLLQKTREDAAVGQEVLLAESRQNAKAISQRLTELEQVKETLEAQRDDAVKRADKAEEEAKQREASHLADTNSLKTMIEELNKEVQRFEEAKKEQAEMVAKLAAKEAELATKCAALEKAEQEISAIKKGSESSSSAADAEIATLKSRVVELTQSLADAEKRAAEIVIPVAESPKKAVDVEDVVELKKSAYLNSAPPAADNSAEVEELKREKEALKKENEKLQEKNTEERVRVERRLVQSHIGKLIGGGATTPALDDAADGKAYEQWLKAVVASIKETQEKAKKAQKEAVKAAPAPAAPVDDEEVAKLRAERESLIEALATLEHELTNIERLKVEQESAYVQRIAELEKSHGKTPLLRLLRELELPYPTSWRDGVMGSITTTVPPSQHQRHLTTTADESSASRHDHHHHPEDTVLLPPERAREKERGLSASKQRIVAEIRCCHAIRRQIAEVRSAIDALPALSTGAGGVQYTVHPPISASQSTDEGSYDGSWEVVA